MKILAVETSGDNGSVALSDDRRVVDQRILSTEGRRHAQALVSEVAELLDDCHLKPTDVDAVAVSIGPGSFTGLRVGVVFAKTFAWANGAKLVAVDTLQAIAQQVPQQHSLVTVISDAQREEVFVNRYEWHADSQSRRPVGRLQIERIQTMANSENAIECGLVTGPGLARFAVQFPEPFVLADEALRVASAATVAELGSLLLIRNELADIHNLEPLYVRRSYAEEKRPSSPGDS
ncbi:MAG: tRNA (adenosine(37)-N6)-threonylcarbamoyltransferase complex dimerization subunit type 1 TsaB [Planctomycetaceae bacterium]